MGPRILHPGEYTEKPAPWEPSKPLSPNQEEALEAFQQVYNGTVIVEVRNGNPMVMARVQLLEKPRQLNKAG